MKLQKSISTILFVALILLFSCREETSQQVEEKIIPQKYDSAYFVSKTNDTAYTNVPFKVEGRLRDTSVYFLEQRHLGDATFNIAEIPRYESDLIPIIVGKPVYFDSMNIVIPGTDTLLPFQDVPIEPIKNKLRSNMIINVSELHHKENARFDLQYLDASSGLVSSYINCILFDKRGFMWIGSSKGLSKYDGKILSHFTEADGLPDDDVTSLFEDSKGNIWMGTQYGGIGKFDGKFVEVYNKENGLPANYIAGFTEDKKGDIWVGMWGGGISRIKGNVIASLTRDHGLFEVRVTDVEADEKGQIWITTNGRGLYIFDGEKLKHHGGKFGYRDSYLLCVKRDSKNRMWLGNWNNIAYIEKDSVFQFTNVNITFPGIPSNQINEDRDGNIWFASGTTGVSKWDNNKLTKFSEEDGLPSNSSSGIAQDASGNIWISSAGGGLVRYNPNSFQYFDESAGLPDKKVYSTIETKSGLIAMATDGGVVFFNDSSVNRLFVNDAVVPFGGTVYDIFEDKDSSLWFSQLNGAVYRLKKDSIKSIGNHQGMHDHNITAILQRKSGEMWFGAWNVGLSRMNNKGHFTVFNAGSGLMNFIITDLVVDKNDNVWIGTDGEGVTVYDGTYFKHITENENLKSNHINSLFNDSYGNLWVLSKKGVNRIFQNQVFQFEYQHLLPDQNVVSMVEDFNHNFWIMTSDGILYLQKKIDATKDGWNSQNYTTKLFTRFDGLISTDFIPRSALVDSKNRIWLGTGRGVIMKNLSSFDLTPVKPSPRIETIKINGNFIDYNNLDNPIYDSLFSDFEKIKSGIKEPTSFENCPQELVLPSGENHLTFIFGCQGWYTDKTVFTYRLVGADDKWSNPTNENWAEYRNLSYGQYQFELKAIGESNIESDILVYKFEILAPWYHTWWARIIFIVIIFFIVRLIVKMRTKQLLIKQQELEEKVKERTNELDKKNIELVGQNSIIKEQQIEAEKRKEEIERQHALLEESHKEIKDSINYAKRIQEAILPTDEFISNLIPDNFVLYIPKDVVAGDFYWIEKLNNTIYFTSADCTGHGVPGAMVSVVCFNALNRSIKEFGETSPERILDKTREIVLETFQLNNAQVNDGMDCALIALTEVEDKKVLNFSGANNSVIIVRNAEIIELKGDKQPVGNFKNMKPFSLHSIELMKGDILYLYTDGYADQFGGNDKPGGKVGGKKLKSKVLKELLLSISHLPLANQKHELQVFLDKWKGDFEQLDDISIFGFKI